MTEVIARVYINSQDEIDRLEKLDRVRSLRMQAETQSRIKAMDSATVYTLDQRKAILKKFRESLQT